LNRLVRNPQIVWRVEKMRQEQILKAMEEGEDVSDKGTVILIMSGMMHQLNLVGGMVWSLCDGTRSLDDVVDALLTEFDVERDVLEGDVRDFVDDLTRRGWLTYA